MVAARRWMGLAILLQGRSVCGERVTNIYLIYKANRIIDKHYIKAQTAPVFVIVSNSILDSSASC